jgi:hypothetical protein
LNRMAWDFYRTQIDFGEEGMRDRIDKPVYLVLGKSFVSSPLEGDVLAGVGKEPIAYAPPQIAQEPPAPPISLELGGPWAFYREFYRAHGLTSLATLVKPQSAFIPDKPLWVPLLLHNKSQQPVDMVLHSSLPDGWTPAAKDVAYRLEPNSSLPVQIFLTAPASAGDTASQVLSWSLTANGKPAGQVELAVYREEIGLPQ